MTTIVADTHKVIQSLEKRGFTKEQAEGVTQALQELDLREFATKADLKAELAKLENTMIKWLVGALIAQTALLIAVLQFFTA